MVDEAVHLTPDSLDEYFLLGVVSSFQLSREVDARLEVDPQNDQLRLFVPAKGGPPEVTNLERLRVDVVEGPEQSRRFRIVVDSHGMHYAAYQLVESIVARLREGFSLEHAVLASIADMKDLLANRDRLTDQEETGLWGELLVLEHIIGRAGEETAFESWLGAAASEHDFSFPGFEAEIKTTRAESRRHLVRGDLQLQISPDRPLFLISIQATLAGASSTGRTLPQMVAGIRGRLRTRVARFDAALRALGYREVDADLYDTKLQLRSNPRAYAIDADFPAVSMWRLGEAVPNAHLVSDLSYRVDVGGLSFRSVPSPLNDFCEAPQ
jgi:hypothetical protein